MTLYDYTLDIPDGPNSPSQDQPNMKINNNNIASLIGVDHIGFNLNDGGYHTVIHQKPYLGNSWNPTAKTGAPAAISGVEQVFALNYTPNYVGAVADTQLFARSGIGGGGGTDNIYQLTGAVRASEGWSWIGGILMQWGFVTITTNQETNSVLFTGRASCIPFPNNLFTVVATPQYDDQPIGPNRGVLAVKSLSTTGFNWAWNSDSGTNKFNGFFWTAIGN